MRRKLALCSYMLGILGVALFWYPHSKALAENEFVAVITIDGAIDDISARYLAQAIEKAFDSNAQLLVVKINTPGGFLDSTRDMVEALLNADIPVAVYVSPSGARAASAGTFITAAADFAVMAPGTNIGAASPVASGGKDIPSTLAKKINEDTAAFIRSVADARDRNAKALEETVTKARSYSVGEALELGVVDLMARDIADLLNKLDGKAVETATGTVVLQTKDSEIREISPTLLNSFLGVISNPNVAFLLLAIGGIGILIEVITPGFIGPGVVGVISLALAFVAFGNLPVNWIGVGLVLFSMVLFYLEMEEAGIGVFGIGGLASFILGAVFLFGGFFSTPDILEPSLHVSPWFVGVSTGVFAVLLALFLRITRADTGASHAYVSASDEALTLEEEWGEAMSDLAPTGRVWVADKEWTATTDTTDVIRQGEEVRVVAVYGDILRVTRYPKESEP